MIKNKIAFFSLALAVMVFGAALAPAQPGPGGKGKGKGKGFGGPGGGPGQDNVAQRALDRLDLTGSTRDKAQEILDSHSRATRKMMDRLRLDLLAQVKQNATEMQYLQFRDAVNTAAGPRGGVSSIDLVEHVMSYDKNKLGKVGKDDLPERMQHLVDKGDLNKDGYLDREEVQMLALKGQVGRGGFGGGGPGGFGGPPTRPFTAADAERALNRLQLTGEPLEKSRKALETYREASRKLTDERRADLVTRMKGTLSEEQLERFSKAVQPAS